MQVITSYDQADTTSAFGMLLLKYRRQLRHCSLPSEIVFRGRLQKGHSLIVSRLSSAQVREIETGRDSPRIPANRPRLYTTNTPVAPTPIPITTAMTGQTEDQAFDRYACMNGLWRYSS